MKYPFEIVNSIPKNTTGRVGWTSPSNIAIVKYWGKHGVQLPRNCSLSLTLSNAHTETFVSYKSSQNNGLTLDFKFEGKENEPFKSKIIKFLNSVMPIYPWLAHIHLDIESSNSFPHSSGIASSASAMSAIAMCINDIESQITGNKIDITKVSYLSRLGSGSASRSVIPEIGVWGAHESINGSSDDYAVSVEDIHPIFKTFHDDILIVSAAEKSVSSTAGHALMEGNVYAKTRYQQANDRIQLLYEAMKTGDVKTFGKIAEDEAMTLHALMMCSDPSYVLIEPGTLDMIREIRNFRANTGADIYFTLDAGPNIHLLYTEDAKDQAKILIESHLMKYTDNGRVIKDKVGYGPKKLV